MILRSWLWMLSIAVVTGMVVPLTNAIEQLNGQIKRRADVVSIFPDEAAIRRLVGTLLLEQNDECVIQKRYMNLESLAATSDNAPIKLPAAPALAYTQPAVRGVRPRRR